MKQSQQPSPELGLFWATGLPQAFCYGRALERKRTQEERHASDHHRHRPPGSEL